MLKPVKEILQRACAANYAVAAANVGNSVEVNAAIEAAEELNAPLILDILPYNIMPCPAPFCEWVRARCEAASVPLAINMEDEHSFEGVRRAVLYGANSVMVNRSSLPFAENVAEVRQAVEIAHKADICVEAALGMYGPDGCLDEKGLCSAAGAARFIRETEADCLAVAVRILNPEGHPEIDFHRLALIKEAVGNYPLVLHGTQGIPAAQIQAACSMGFAKINFSKDLKTAALQAVSGGQTGNVFELAGRGLKEKLMELILLCGARHCSAETDL